MRDTRTLLAAAAQLYDEPGNGLQASSRVAAWRGFHGGAAWMRTAMSVVRGSAPLGDARFARLGLCKYTLAILATLLVLAALWRLPILAVPAAIVAFYLFEARMVFVFPLALDGEANPFRASHRLLRRTSPPVAATARVMSIAARMLLGGIVGRGFVRSWCVGCLAVVLWYEDARETVLVPAIAGFELGSRAPLLVRHERVELPASATTWRLLYASDLHLTVRREHIGAQLVDIVARQPFDAVLLGGDLLDRREGAAVLASTVKALAAHAPVAAVAGNHDSAIGNELARNAVRAGGGHWLHDFEVDLVRDGARLQLHHDVRPRSAGDGSTVRVLVAHYPSVFERAAAHYDVVLAGHLHGGQCVLWHRGARLYPGSWFSRWTGLRFVGGESVMLVSRGAADTLPVRFRCPREVLCCEIGRP